MRWLLLLLLPAPASAATFFVEAAGTGPYQDIQPAIDAARDGDRVLVAPGTYGPVDFGGLGIEVRSVEPGLAIIDGGGLGPAVEFGEQAPAEALLHGFTITGGSGFLVENVGILAGGGVLVTRGSTPRISHNTIVGNTAASGAGIAVINAAPALYGNVVSGNVASPGVGGLWVHNPDEPAEVVISCNEFLENEGDVVGGLLLDEGLVALHNNAFNANEGERGALYATAAASGLVANNTFVSNVSAANGAAGIESAADALDFTSNIVAYGQVGWGAVRTTSTASWTYNLLWDNAAGDWSGSAGPPDLADGNLALEPDFTFFTLVGGQDDDLSLTPTSPQRDLGDPLLDDLDGSRNALGLDGGPREGCDLDGDGVRASEGDCRPDDADFHPGAHEVVPGIDADCSGLALLDERTFVADDGAATATGPWDFGPPSLLPGLGYQSADGWCTVCGGDPTAAGDLTFEFDLSTVDAAATLELVHAWDFDPSQGGVVAERLDTDWVQVAPELGYPEAAFPSGDLAARSSLGLWSGTIDRWAVDTFDVSDAAGGALSFRLHADPGAAPVGAGSSVGRIAVFVEDADGDQRAHDQDCDDTDDTIYVGATEVLYDGIDQDCDGADLTDADGDGFEAIAAGGTDCDDLDSTSNPDGTDSPYDGVDQDCDGADLTDVDGDGFDAEEVGGLDCDDEDDAIGPDEDEIPYDGVDQDCDGADLTDVDGDGVDGDEDCDDEDALVWPGNIDFCDDGLDNDCDGTADNQGDLDGDGVDVCDGDCDDTNAAVTPNAEEVCDGLDTDCDGTFGAGELDGDGDGALPCGGDCDDSDARIASGLPEVCDGIDNDCDRGIDEDHDLDLDGYSGCTVDCDDQRSSVYPGAAIDCEDNLDHDCDGVRDFEQEDCVNPPSGCSVGGGGSLLWLLPLLAYRSRRTQRAPARD